MTADCSNGELFLQGNGCRDLRGSHDCSRFFNPTKRYDQHHIALHQSDCSIFIREGKHEYFCVIRRTYGIYPDR